MPYIHWNATTIHSSTHLQAAVTAARRPSSQRRSGPRSCSRGYLPSTFPRASIATLASTGLAQPPLPDGTDGSTTVPEVTGTQKAGSSKDITAGPVSNGAGKSVANEDSGANRSSGSTDGSQAECRDDGNDRGASGPEPAWVLHPCAEWCHIAAAITTRHATIGWLDMRQPAKRGRGSQPNLEQHAGAQSDVSGAETQEMPQQPTVAASTAASSGGMDGTGKDFGGGESRRMAVGEDGIMDGRDEDVESGQTGWDNFLPGMGRWRLAMKMEDAILDFPAAERWAPATSREEGRASQDLEAVCR